MDLYVSHPLFDKIMRDFNLKNDSALARALGLSRPVVSKIRHRKRPVGDTVLLQIHDRTGWSVKEIKALLAEDE